jgi:hypothetical protein
MAAMTRPTLSHRALFLAAPLMVLAAAGSAAAQKAISPGYWETTSKVTGIPLAPPKTERRCIQASDVAKFMEGKINHIYKCTYPTKEVGGGKMVLKGSCATKDGPPVPISGEGAFTADSMHIEARVVLNYGGMSIPVHAVTDAKRLSETCPDPAAATTGK